MAATATAPRAKRAPTKARPRKPAARRARAASASRRTPRRGVTPAAGFAIPAAAVGRTAVAVGDIADSGLVVRLTRSRLWIGLIGALLVGIVGLNVYALSLSAAGSKVALRSEALARENSAMRAQLSERLSNDRIQGAAANLGLIAPGPDAIRYLKASEADAKVAAKRILGGELGSGSAADASTAETAPVAPEPVAEPAPAPAPAPAEPVPATAPPAAAP